MQSLQDQHRAQIQVLQDAIAETNVAVQPLKQPAETPEAPTPAPENEATPTREIVTTGPKRTKAILPDPPKFDGTRSEYEGWRSLVKDKIEVDGEVIGSDRNQFKYVSSRLEGKGLQSALTFITICKDHPEASIARLFKYLDAMFGDHTKVQRAVETLRTMKQGPRELFSAFLLRFEKVLAEAGGMA
jgi:hypothetical protein